MKKILILGGFPQMIDVVMTARSLGVYTIVADKDPSSPSKRFADLAVDISTADIRGLSELCVQEGVNGVFTGFEDFNIHIARKLAESLGLPFYATKEQLDTVTDKLNFKKTCREWGVPVIEQYTEDEAVALGAYPYIVKPSDSYGSRGIKVCRNRDELSDGVKGARAVSSSGNEIIERFIDTDHGVEWFYTAVNGNIRLTATADRYTVKNGETTVPLPTAEVFPSKHAEKMHGEIDGRIRAMLGGIGIKNGLVLVQSLLDEDGNFYIYEMAYRLTGEQHYRLVARQEGINLAEFMIKLALGEDVSEFDTDMLCDSHFVRPSVNLAVILSPGKVKEIEGLADVYKLDEVISYNLTHAVGDSISASGNYSHMLIRVNMVAENYEKLRLAIDRVGELVNVTSEDGEDMVAARFALPPEN
ncbi:MAG: hypothetical protein IKB38_04225 [Clostridia bacterium]|nr:hypothetical protein [Clostridia bacterium]